LGGKVCCTVPTIQFGGSCAGEGHGDVIIDAGSKVHGTAKGGLRAEVDLRASKVIKGCCWAAVSNVHCVGIPHGDLDPHGLCRHAIEFELWGQIAQAADGLTHVGFDTRLERTAILVSKKFSGVYIRDS
jgi:hypothetical protein